MEQSVIEYDSDLMDMVEVFDSARFTEIGVEAVSIIGLLTALIWDGLVFHTSNDTVEHIEPETLEACLSVAYRYIHEKGHTV